MVRHLPVAVACGHDILVIPGSQPHFDPVGDRIKLAPQRQAAGIERRRLRRSLRKIRSTGAGRSSGLHQVSVSVHVRPVVEYEYLFITTPQPQVAV